MDELEVSVESLDAVPEALHGYYAKADDGMYRLKINTPDVSGLKSALDRERKDRKEAREKLAQLRQEVDGIDLDKARDLMNKSTAGKGQDTDVDAIVKERIQKIVGEKDRTISDLKTRVDALFFGEQVAAAAAKARVRPKALELVRDRARMTFHLENGEYVPYGDDGKVMYGENGSPMTLDGFVNHLKTECDFLFEQNSGGGAARNGQQAHPGGASGGYREGMSSIDMLKLGRKQR